VPKPRKLVATAADETYRRHLLHVRIAALKGVLEAGRYNMGPRAIAGRARVRNLIRRLERELAQAEMFA
jgi:hypothetical protein